MFLQVRLNRARSVGQALGFAGFSEGLAPIARGQAISSMGSGLWFTVWALYLTREVHLSLGQAGVAMSVAGAAGFVAPVPLGRLADRLGSLQVFRVLLVVEAIAGLGFAVCSAVWQVMIVASAVAACSQGGAGVSSAIVIQLTEPRNQIDMLARMRSCSHAGQAVGAALGAVVIGVDARGGYLAAVVLNSACLFTSAVTLRRVPVTASTPGHPAGPRLGALRNVPFTTLAGVCGVLCLCWGMMSSGLPLWIANDTRAPHATSGAIVFSSTLAITFFQTTFSRRSTTPTAAARAAQYSGLSLAASCLLLALSAAPAAALATAVLICAGATHILGELWFAAAAKGFSVPLMDAAHPAEYQSVFAAGEGLAIMLAPALMTAVVIPNHTAGWCGLAAVFLLAGISSKPAARWAAKTNHRRGPVTTGSAPP